MITGLDGDFVDLEATIRDVIKDNGIFKNEQCFNKRYMPPSLLHCEKTIKQLSGVFKPLFNTSRNFIGVFISVVGDAGVGKTSIIHYFCDRLVKLANDSGIKAIYAYYNCYAYRTKSSILRDMLPTKFKMFNSRGFSDNELLSNLNIRLRREKQHLILVLDEAHVIGLKQILSLIHSTDIFNLGESRISIILINRPPEMRDLQRQGLSDYITNNIPLPHYSRGELKDILKNRIALGLNSNVIQEEVIERVVELASKIGSVSCLLEIVYKAAKLASQLSSKMITIELVEEVKDEILSTVSDEILNSLSPHELISLLGVAFRLNHIGILNANLEDAYQQYRIECKKYSITPNALVSFRRHIKALSQRRIIEYSRRRLKRRGRGQRGRISLNGYSARSLKTQVTELLLKRKEEGFLTKGAL